MYVRPQPQNYKYPREVRLPENYGGSTFREAVEEPVSAEQSAEQTEEIEEIQETVQSTPPAEIKETAVQAGSGFKLRLGSLFGNKGGIGTEEILILALILLLSDSEENDDLILFLILLFFIK